MLAERMSEVLSEFARTLATDFPIQKILDHLVHRIVTVLPIDGAGVTLISPDSDPRYIAASDESALRFEQLQTELGEGPCLAAYTGNKPISIPDLAEDSRFPVFAQHALKEGLVAVFTFPLRHGDLRLGALDLYRHSAGHLSAPEMAAAQTLADVTTAYLLNAQARVDLQAVSATERDALEALRLVDRKKTEFLTTTIHELRTPMTSIVGNTELLQDDDVGELNDLQHKLINTIDRNSHRLKLLADDLLTLAELEEGAVLDNHTDLDLRDVVLAAQSATDALLSGRRLQVTFEVPPVPVVIDGNAENLERLTSNLLTNAVKFTHDGGRVRCTLRSAGGTAFVEVADDGIGIPETEQADVFTRFFRASTARQEAISGSGLGLNIVESIAHNHGGKVSLVSTLGGGTTFLVELPLHEAAWAADCGRATPGHAADAAGGREPGSKESDVLTGHPKQPDDQAPSSMDLGIAINRVDDGFFALDRAWHVQFSNAAAARMLGRHAADLIGSGIWAEFPPAVGTAFDLRCTEALETQQVVELEEYVEQLGRWFSTQIYPAADGVTLILRDTTHLRALMTEHHALLIRLLKAGDQERARIAADVHEDSVQALVAVSLQLQLLRRHLTTTSPKVESLLESLSALVTIATDRLRALLFSLEPTDASIPIANSIRTFAAHIFHESSTHWSVDDVEVGEELLRVERSQALRIIKEALNNTRAHAEASEVVITLKGDSDGLEIVISDNGVTVDPASFVSAPGHRGLATMRDRAAILGGTCAIEPSSPHGCTVKIYVPRLQN